MAQTPTSRGRAQDRARVAGGQDHKYEATKEGVSKDAVKKAVKSAGNARKKVEAEIGRR
ncbi:DUF3606 domain-containing protein [Rhizobium anhuiense]|uniref:DUF3606 domain-containing protein n=1 Tax=Rhizobium anhuiense TaxID=1184720 RepID=A0ABX4J5B4_9HYPH|nr:DUF3606 domain-containing protein [Rhizobium anhuiense]PDS41364.1 DUF3606 domain-containing protein [Rhizobium anhuiense]PDS49621.1 DUF3606 domain-containing protein [Rhizobium anhuiense]